MMRKNEGFGQKSFSLSFMSSYKYLELNTFRDLIAFLEQHRA